MVEIKLIVDQMNALIIVKNNNGKPTVSPQTSSLTLLDLTSLEFALPPIFIASSLLYLIFIPKQKLTHEKWPKGAMLQCR